MTCQFQVYLSQNLSIFLKKCVFFSKRMELLGIDCCNNGNCPVMSKKEVYKHWPPFVVARDIASFLGFMNFYSKFIPYFEHRAAPLCALVKLEMTAPVEKVLTPTHHTAHANLIDALVSDPCIARYVSTKRNFLLTDYSRLGFGCEIFQPSDDPASLATMQREVEGGDCEFLLPKSLLELPSERPLPRIGPSTRNVLNFGP